MESIGEPNKIDYFCDYWKKLDIDTNRHVFHESNLESFRVKVWEAIPDPVNPDVLKDERKWPKREMSLHSYNNQQQEQVFQC